MQHRAVLKAEGRDTGGKGNASALITAQLEPIAADVTKVTVATDLTITGKVAQFGRGALADVSEKLLKQFVDNLETTVLDERRRRAGGRGRRDRRGRDRRGRGGQRGRRRRRERLGHRRGPAAPRRDGPAAAPAASATSAATAEAPAPGVRTIESAPVEPIDLLDAAGAPLVKRLAAAHRWRGRPAPGVARPAPSGLTGPGPAPGRPERPSADVTDVADRAAVAALLGREPQGAFEVVVRDEHGAPVVIRNAPLLDDGTPMPTRYWLVEPALSAAVGRLEAAGGVRRAEARGAGRRARRRPPPLRGRARRRAARRTRRPGARAAAWAGPGRASSASTPTTPGTWPAATTRSGAGSRPSSSEPAERAVTDGRRHRHRHERGPAARPPRRPARRCAGPT